MFRKALIIICLLFAFFQFTACNESKEEVKKDDKEQWVGDADPVQSKLKERGEQATRALGYQKEVKEKVSELPVIELFTRETLEKEAIAKLGKPDSVKELKLENVKQRVLYYNQPNFALWFWQKDADQSIYQYRATVSLKEGKFDVPIHNVFDEGELKQVQAIFEDQNK